MFRRFTDPGAARELLQKSIPDLSPTQSTITRCTVEYCRHKLSVKPHLQHQASLLICYRLQVSSRTTEKIREQFIYIRAYLDGRSEREFDNFNKPGVAGRTPQPAVAHLRELDAIAWRFPDDPRLVHLSNVVDVSKVTRHLPYRDLPPGLDCAGDIRDIKLQVVRYKPEHHCLSRYEIQWGPTTAPRTTALYGKTFPDERALDVHRGLAHFYQRFERDAKHLVTARPLAYGDAVHTVWQTEVQGVSLVNTIDWTSYEHHMQLAVRGLASIQTSDLTSATTIAIDDYVREIEKKATKLRQLSSRCQVRTSIDRFIEWMKRHAPTGASLQNRLIHGDFQLRQLLLADGRLAIFDFDDLACGDPLSDLAEFIVDLHFYGFDPQLVQASVTSFYRCYESMVSWDTSMERLDWHVRTQFLDKAYHLFTSQAPGFADSIPQVIEMAERGIQL